MCPYLRMVEQPPRGPRRDRAAVQVGVWLLMQVRSPALQAHAFAIAWGEQLRRRSIPAMIATSATIIALVTGVGFVIDAAVADGAQLSRSSARSSPPAAVVRSLPPVRR